MPFEMDSTISIHAPARGATQTGNSIQAQMAISIHAPREGGDCGHCDRLAGHQYFNPRPPRGGRL